MQREGDSIQIVIRVRPMNEQEITRNKKSCVLIEPLDTTKIILDCANDPKIFFFDYIANENVTQQQIFQIIGKPFSYSCIEGFNSTIFAYGQTGAGKTYTMLGGDNQDDRGLQPRVFDFLFGLLQQQQQNQLEGIEEILVKCSYLEIYNEQILDLLSDSGTFLHIREDLKKGVYIEGLQEETVNSSFEAINLLNVGARNRHVGATAMNFESSRSHSVLTLTVESKRKQNDIQVIKQSRMHFVDLAGSERQQMTASVGDRLKEAGNINKSLTILGLVINSLVEQNQGKQRHIPYRDSKLTFLLKDSLGGNSKTSIIANINPTSYQETLSTLKFAQRAKLIKNNAIINEESTGNIEQLKNEIQRLKNELGKYTTIIQTVENQDSAFFQAQNGKSISYEKYVALLQKFEVQNQQSLENEKQFKNTIEQLSANDTQLNNQLQKQKQLIVDQQSLIDDFIKKDNTQTQLIEEQKIKEGQLLQQINDLQNKITQLQLEKEQQNQQCQQLQQQSHQQQQQLQQQQQSQQQQQQSSSSSSQKQEMLNGGQSSDKMPRKQSIFQINQEIDLLDSFLADNNQLSLVDSRLPLGEREENQKMELEVPVQKADLPKQNSEKPATTVTIANDHSQSFEQLAKENKLLKQQLDEFEIQNEFSRAQLIKQIQESTKQIDKLESTVQESVVERKKLADKIQIASSSPAKSANDEKVQEQFIAKLKQEYLDHIEKLNSDIIALKTQLYNTEHDLESEKIKCQDLIKMRNLSQSQQDLLIENLDNQDKIFQEKNDKYKQLQQEKSNLESCLNSFEIEMKVLAQDLENSNSQIQKLNQEIENLQQKKKDNEHQFREQISVLEKKFQEQISGYQEKISDLQTLIKKLTQENSELEYCRKKLQEDYETATSALEFTEKDLDAVKSQFKEQEEREKNLEKSNIQLTQQVEKTTNDLEFIKKSTIESQTNDENNPKPTVDMYNIMCVENKRVNDQNNEMSKEIHELKLTIEQLSKQSQKMSSEYNDLQTKHGEIIISENHYRMAYQENKIQLNRLKEGLSDYKDQIQEIESLLQQKQSELDIKISYQQQLLDEIEKQKGFTKKAKEERNLAEEEKRIMKLKLDNVQDALKNAQQELSSSEKKSLEIHSRLQSNLHEKNLIEEKFNVLKSSIQTVMNTYNDGQKEITSLKNMFDAKIQELDAVKKENYQLASDKKFLFDKSKEQLDKIDKLENQLYKLEGKTKKLREKLIDYKKIVEDYKISQQEHEKRIEQLVDCVSQSEKYIVDISQEQGDQEATKSKIHQLGEQIKQSNTQIAQLQQKLTQGEQLAELQNKTIGDLRIKIQQQEQELYERQQNITKLENEKYKSAIEKEKNQEIESLKLTMEEQRANAKFQLQQKQFKIQVLEQDIALLTNKQQAANTISNSISSLAQYIQSRLQLDQKDKNFIQNQLFQISKGGSISSAYRNADNNNKDDSNNNNSNNTSNNNNSNNNNSISNLIGSLVSNQAQQSRNSPLKKLSEQKKSYSEKSEQVNLINQDIINQQRIEIYSEIMKDIQEAQNKYNLSFASNSVLKQLQNKQSPQFVSENHLKQTLDSIFSKMQQQDIMVKKLLQDLEERDFQKSCLEKEFIKSTGKTPYREKKSKPIQVISGKSSLSKLSSGKKTQKRLKFEQKQQIQQIIMNNSLTSITTTNQQFIIQRDQDDIENISQNPKAEPFQNQ